MGEKPEPALALARGNGVHFLHFREFSCFSHSRESVPALVRPQPNASKSARESRAREGPDFQKWAARELDGNAPFRSPEVSLGREENSVGEVSGFARLRASSQPVSRKGGQKHPRSLPITEPALPGMQPPWSSSLHALKIKAVLGCSPSGLAQDKRNVAAKRYISALHDSRDIAIP